MDKKKLIISKLEDLKKSYQLNIDKKWNLHALTIAINSIKEYDKEIFSGEILRKDIKGIGIKISKRINEILESGTLKELNNTSQNDTSQNDTSQNDTSQNDTIQNNTSQNNYLENILLITGVGIVRAKKWLDLGLNNIDDVKKAIIKGTIKTTHHIDIGIKYYYDFQKKIPRSEIDNIKILLNNEIKKIDKKLIFEICGSYRRGAIESGDVDILISHPNYSSNIEEHIFLHKIVKKLTKINFITENLTSNGNTKFMGVCKLQNYTISRRIDIRVVDYNYFYTSLIYFTGSKNFNIIIRNKALEKNLSLNEYFLKNINNNSIRLLTYEKEIFEILNIPYLKPEER
jgi:DNA polymerase beta